MTPNRLPREVIEEASDAWAASPRARKLSRRVIRAQNVLRRLVSKRAWVAYLKVEEAVNDREFARGDALAVVILRLARRVARDDVVVRLGRHALQQLRAKQKGRRS